MCEVSTGEIQCGEHKGAFDAVAAEAMSKLKQVMSV